MSKADQAAAAGLAPEEVEALRAAEAKSEESAPAETKEAVPETPAEEVSEGSDRVVPVAPVLSVESIEGIDDRLKTIRNELRTAQAQANRMEISDEDYAALQDRLESERESLIERRTAAKMQQGINKANEEATFQTALRYFYRDAKKSDGIDYAGNKYQQAMFAAAYADVAAMDEFKDRGIDAADEVFQRAHDIVRAQLGKTKPAEAKPGDKSAADKIPKTVPKTLADLPAAAQASVGDDLMEKVNTLYGEDLEVFLAKMPKAQREQLRRRSN